MIRLSCRISKRSRLRSRSWRNRPVAGRRRTMNPPSISLVDERQIDEVVGLFDVQLREHGITISADDLRAVARTVVADPRCGFMLVANAAAGRAVGVAYASTILTLEHGGVSGWLEELYVLPEWRGKG